MSFILKRESWPRFIAKAAIVTLVLIAVGYSFSHRFSIGMDTQLVKCIPGYTFYLIDKKDKSLGKDNIYAFKAQGLSPFYEDGTQMVKFLRGMPGDEVEVTESGTITINGNYVGYGLEHAKALNKQASDFAGKAIIKAGYWFMGTDYRSFDSRYWGTVENEQVIGRAYPLF